MNVSIIQIIKEYIKAIIDLKNNKADKASLITLYGTTHSATPTVNAKGSNYSSVAVSGAEAVLCGNVLRIYFSATRSANTGTGDVTNETIVIAKVPNFDGLFGSYAAMGGNSGKTGPVTTFYTILEKKEAGYWYFKIILTGIHSAAKEFNGHALVPIRLNVPV